MGAQHEAIMIETAGEYYLMYACVVIVGAAVVFVFCYVIDKLSGE